MSDLEGGVRRAVRDDYSYELVEGWPNLPDDIVLNDVCGVAVDSQKNAYLFNRGDQPVVVIDGLGNFKSSWGGSLFKRPHGAFMGPDDTLWLADDRDQTVRQCALDGRVLMQLGIPSQASDFMSGQPFNRPTHVALSPLGEIYVSDGYGNSSVHKFSPDGRHILSWGGPGNDPGEFNIVHNISCDDQGWVYVADRENFRVQVFDRNGRFETQWHDMYRPQGLFTTRGSAPITYIGENGTATAVETSVPNLGARISIYDQNGRRLARIGGPRPGLGPLEFLSPHSIAVDDDGDIYIGEVSWNTWPKKFPKTERPLRLRSVRKLRRLD